ncbi:MAG: alpha/beta hydrolase [Janthinobacterium lividum]
MRGWIRLFAGSAILAAGLATAQPVPVMPPADMARMAAARAAADALPDSPGTGPYPAIKTVEPGLPDHVVYLPADLSRLGARKLGILAWANGGCSDDAASARQHLAEIASHGYVVIAPGSVLSGPGAPPRPAQSAPAPLGIKTTSAQVAAGIDWALAENSRSGSPLYRRIDPALVAVSGHSCGGLQALQLAADPRVHAVIIHNSGVFTDGGNPIAGIKVDKSLLKTLHTPVLYVMGGTTDVAWPNGTDDFDKIPVVPAMLLSHDTGHGGTFGQANGGENAQVAVAWLEWQLRGDPAAAHWFKGADCRLCTDKAWTVRKKGID